MQVLVYKPSADPTWPFAVQLLFDEFSRFGRWLLPELVEMGLSIEVAETYEEVAAKIEMLTNNSETTVLLGFCFPHQVPQGGSSRKLLALPFMFDTYSVDADANYDVPFQDWPAKLTLIDGLIVASQTVETKVKNLIGTKTPIHLVEPKIPHVEINQLKLGNSEIVDLPAICCLTDMYLSTADGKWDSLQEPPPHVLARFANTVLDQTISTWSLGNPALSGVWPIGFYPSDLWGSWAELQNATILLPVIVSGPIHITIQLIGSGVNVGREITVRFGSEARQVKLSPYLEAMHFEFCPNEPTSQLSFEGYDLDFETDRRGLGVGVASITLIQSAQWTGSKLSWPASRNDSSQLSLVGFHIGDQWGSWAKSKDAFVLLPAKISGRIRLLINLAACGENIGRHITISVGEKTFSALLESDIQEYCFEFDVATLTDRVHFQGFAIDYVVDARGLGFGIESIQIFRLDDFNDDKFEWSPANVNAGGVTPFGFHGLERWGGWAKSRDAKMMLSTNVSGRQQLAISLVASGINVGREITVRFGDDSRTATLSSSPEHFIFEFDLQRPVNSISFEGYEIDRESDGRGLGIGIGALQIERSLGIFAKFRRKLLARNQEKLNISTEFTARPQLASAQSRSKTEIQITGTVFIMNARPSDLVSEYWNEIIKDFGLVYDSQMDVHLVVVCPSSWMTTFLLPVCEFIDRMSAMPVLVHFVFLDNDDPEFAKLLSHPNVILLKREDGLDFEMARFAKSNMHVTIGPVNPTQKDSAEEENTLGVGLLKQPTQLIRGLDTPVKMGAFFDNQMLCQSLETISRLAIPKDVTHHLKDENIRVRQQLESIIWDGQDA